MMMSRGKIKLILKLYTVGGLGVLALLVSSIISESRPFSSLPTGKLNVLGATAGSSGDPHISYGSSENTPPYLDFNLVLQKITPVTIKISAGQDDGAELALQPGSPLPGAEGNVLIGFNGDAQTSQQPVRETLAALKELTLGDELVVEAGGQKFTYTIEAHGLSFSGKLPQHFLINDRYLTIDMSLPGSAGQGEKILAKMAPLF